MALHNIRKIRPFLTQHAAQLLVQALVISRLDYCNTLLAGLPSNTIKPLQMIQNAAARLVFSEPKRAHVTPLVISLHWLPVAARIKFKPQAQHPPTSTHWWQSTSPQEDWDLRAIIVFLNCKSLWIKASAKWINVNVNNIPHLPHTCHCKIFLY